jgi:D-arabinose 1-dehydrogenase-like Zn-dependent alcohol dehydrogenase
VVDASFQAVREATRMIEAGQIATRIDPRPLTLDDVLEAYDSVRSGTAAGRLVVDI